MNVWATFPAIAPNLVMDFDTWLVRVLPYFFSYNIVWRQTQLQSGLCFRHGSTMPVIFLVSIIEESFICYHIIRHMNTANASAETVTRTAPGVLAVVRSTWKTCYFCCFQVVLLSRFKVFTVQAQGIFSCHTMRTQMRTQKQLLWLQFFSRAAKSAIPNM